MHTFINYYFRMTYLQLLKLLDKRRQDLDISKADLCRRAGFSPQMYHKAITGKSLISGDKLFKMAEIVRFKVIILPIEYVTE